MWLILGVLLAVLVVGVPLGVVLRDMGALDAVLPEKIDASESERLLKEASDASFKAGEQQGHAEGKTAGYTDGYKAGIRDGIDPNAIETMLDNYVQIPIPSPGGVIEDVFRDNFLDRDSGLTVQWICIELFASYDSGVLNEWTWAFLLSDGSTTKFSTDWDPDHVFNTDLCYQDTWLEDLAKISDVDQVRYIGVYARVNGVWDRKVVPMPRG